MTECDNADRVCTVGIHWVWCIDLTCCAAVMHSILVLFQANTLNVAFNSHNKSLLTIMMSNNVCNHCVHVSDCLSICQCDNSRTFRDIITIFSGHHPRVKRADKFENGYIGLCVWWFNVSGVLVLYSEHCYNKTDKSWHLGNFSQLTKAEIGVCV